MTADDEAQRAPETDRLAPHPAPVVASAFGLALLGLLIPLALVGALFAGVVLARRGRPGTGLAVVVLGVACVVAGVTLLR